MSCSWKKTPKAKQPKALPLSGKRSVHHCRSVWSPKRMATLLFLLNDSAIRPMTQITTLLCSCRLFVDAVSSSSLSRLMVDITIVGGRLSVTFVFDSISMVTNVILQSHVQFRWQQHLLGQPTTGYINIHDCFECTIYCRHCFPRWSCCRNAFTGVSGAFTYSICTWSELCIYLLRNYVNKR